MLLDAELLGLEPLQRGTELLGMDLHQEPEVAEIDAEHRHRPVGHEPERAEHRAVAAEADQCLDLLGELLVTDAGDTGGTTVGVVVAHEDTATAGFDPGQQRLHHGRVVAARMKHEPDAHLL